MATPPIDPSKTSQPAASAHIPPSPDSSIDSVAKNAIASATKTGTATTQHRFTRLDAAKLNSLQKFAFTPLTPLARFAQWSALKLARLYQFFDKKEPPHNLAILSHLVRASAEKEVTPSLSILLPFMADHLEKSGQGDAPLISRLTQCSRWADQVSDLQKMKKFKSGTAPIVKLQKEITKAIEGLQNGEKLLIPSGYQRIKPPFQEALIEVEKIADNNFTVRLLSLNDEDIAHLEGQRELASGVLRHNPVLEFSQVSLQSLNLSIEPLLLIQLPQIYLKTPSSDAFRRLQKATDFLGLLKEGPKKKEEQKYTTALDVLCTTYQKTPIAPAKPVMKMSKTNDSKVLLAYMKTQLKDKFKPEKLNMELSIVFQCVNQEGAELLRSQKSRDLVYLSARKLIYELEKYAKKFGASPPEHIEALLDLKQIITTIEAIDQKAGQAKMPSVHLEKFKNYFKISSTTEPRKLKSPKISNRSVQEAATVDLKLTNLPKSSQALTKLAESTLPILQQQLKVVKKLYKEKSYATMEFLLFDLVHQLPSHTSPFWDKMSTEVRTSWYQELSEINYFLFDSRILQESPSSPDKVVLQLKTMTIIDRLFVQKAKTEPISSPYYHESKIVCFPPHSDWWDVLQDDSYFRITSPTLQQTASELQQYWEEQTDQRTTLDLKKEWDYTFFSKTESYCIQIAGKPGSGSLKNYIQKVENKLPPEVRNQRNIAWTCNALSNHPHSFNFAAEIGTAFKLIKAAGSPIQLINASLFDPSREKLQKIGLKAVRDQLHNHPPGIDSKTGERKHFELQVVGHFFTDVEIGLEPSGLTHWFHHDNNFYKNYGRYLDKQTDKIVKFNMGMQNDVSEDSTQLTEKTLVKKAATEEEMLLQMIQADNSRLEQTFGMFSAHPELLSKPSVQRLFELNLYKQGVLLEKIREQPDFAVELLLFAKNNIEIARQNHDIQRMLFLMEIYNNVRNFVHVAKISEDERQNIETKFPALEDYEDLLQSCGDNNLDKKFVYGALLAHYNAKMEARELPDDKKEAAIKQILKGYFLWQSTPVDEKDYNSEIERQVENAMMRIRPDLQKLLAQKDKSTEILTELADEFHLPHFSKIKGRFPLIKAGKITIDFNRGRIFEGKRAKGKISPKILKDENVQKLFFKGKKTLGLDAELEFKIDPNTQEPITIYTFKDRPDVRLIERPGRDLIIQMKMKDKYLPMRKHWYELQSSTSIENVLEWPDAIADLIVGRYVWRQIDKPSQIIVKDENNATELYTIQMHLDNKKGYRLNTVTRTSDKLMLMDPWGVTDNPEMLSAINGGALTAVENSEHIKCWGTSLGKLKEFEFPRIKTAEGTSLAYQLKKKRKKGLLLDAKQYPGFFMHFSPAPLVVKSDTKNIELLPRMFRDYQLLENSKTGSKKILIPLRELTREGFTPEKTKENLARYSKWSDHVRLSRADTTLDTQIPLEFTINPSGTSLKTESHEGYLFLAYLFFTSNNYEQALEYLEKSLTALPMSPTHREIYHWIDTWGDPTPEGKAFRLKAALALRDHQAKQEQAPNPEEIWEATVRLQELFNEYEEDRDKLPKNFHLSEEQITCYTHAIDQTILCSMKPLPYSQPTAPIQSIPWTPTPMEAVDSSTAALLYIGVPPVSHSKKKIFPEELLGSNSAEMVLNYFNTLHDIIHKEPINSEEYIKCKTYIELAHPDKTYQGPFSLLKYLIYIKEKHPHSISELQKFEMPVQTKSSNQALRIRTALKSGDKKDKDIEALEKWIDSLSAAYKALVPTPVQSPPVPPQLPIRQMEVDPSKLPASVLEMSPSDKKIIGPYWHPRTFLRLFPTPQDIVDTFKNLRVGELKKRCEQLQAKLPTPPTSSPPPAQALKKVSSDVVDLKSILDAQFFKITSDQEGKKPDLTFFDGYKDQKDGDKSVERLVDDFKKDTQTFIEKPVGDLVTLKSDADLDKLNLTVQENLKGITTIRQQLENQIIEILQPKEVLASHSKLLKPMQNVPKRLIGLYVDNQLEQVNKIWNLNLSDGDKKSLDELITEWMAATVQENMATKGLEKLQTITDLKKLNKQELNELYQILTPKRFFDIKPPAPTTHYRELLAIEFSTGFTLRANQVETIHSMLQDPNQVKQLGMGQGKSSVLLPMLLHRMADGRRLPIALVPEWLYKIVAADLDKSCAALFGMKIIEFKFDRNTIMDDEWLYKHYADLSASLQSDHHGPRNAIVTTKSYLLSFRNKFIELQEEAQSLTGDERKDIDQKLERMALILTLLKKHGAIISDEIDSILNIRNELNYGLGAPPELDAKKYNLGIDIYKVILNSPYGERLLRNEQGSFTQSDIKDIQSLVAAKFFSKWQNDLGTNEALFKAYILGEKIDSTQLNNEHIPLFMDDLQRTNKLIFDQVAFLRQYVAKTFPSTLTQSGNVHYGRAANGITTIPYKANNTPSDAEFGEEFEYISYLIQNYLQEGMNRDQVKLWINQLIKKSDAEMYEQQMKGEKINFQETATYKAFKTKYKKDLAAVSREPALLNELTDHLNSKSDVKLDFLQTQIFPVLHMTDEQVSSNAVDVVNMVNTFGGFTGTTWNLFTFGNKIRITDAQTPGTDGKTISLLLNMFHNNDLSIRPITLDAEHPLKSVVAVDSNFMNLYDSLIDGGYYLKGMSSQDVLDELGKSKGRKKALVYITPDNEKKIQTFGKDDAQPLQNRKDIAMKERFSYYDQAHTTGTDIPHDLNARAAVTIGDKHKIRDLLQDVWRFRKLDQGQKIDFIISDGVAKLIEEARPASRSGAITMEDIILFCIKNQADVEAEDNLRAEKARLKNIVSDGMFWQLVDTYAKDRTKTLTERGKKAEKLYKPYREFFIKKNSNKPTDMAKIVSSDKTGTVLKQLKDDLVHQCSTIASKNKVVQLSSEISSLNNYHFLKENQLPKETESTQSYGKGSQVQQQQQQQQQQQRQIQTQMENIGKISPVDYWIPWLDFAADLDWRKKLGIMQPKLPIAPIIGKLPLLQLIWESSKDMQRAKNGIAFLDDDVMVTPNFSSDNDLDLPPSMTLEQRLLRQRRIPMAQVLVLHNSRTGEYRYLLLDVKDYERIVKIALEQDNSMTAAVYDLRRPQKSLLIKSTAAGNKNPWRPEQEKEIRSHLVKLKVLGGQYNFYDKEERETLQNWVKANPNLKTYVEEKLLNTPSLEATYEGSILQKNLSVLITT